MWWWLAACTDEMVKIGEESGIEARDSVVTADSADRTDSVEVIVGTGEDSDEPDDSPDPDDPIPGPCADLYDPDVPSAFELDISDEDWRLILADYAAGRKNYHPAVFRYGGQEVNDARVRLKGNPDFSWFTEKMQFVIAFNEVDETGRFEGLRKIALDASWYEPTLLRDRVSWAVMRRAGGVPTVCANTASLTINGAYYGAYTSIEFLDHEWLEREFGDADATGTLWKYGYDAVSNAEASDGRRVDQLWRTTDVDVLETLGDVDEWVAEWAAEVVLGDDDGYWCCAHNFYLYEHPTRGILFVPWDFDDNFDVQPYDTHPIDGYYSGLFNQPQLLAVLSDPAWNRRFLDHLERFNEAMDPALVEADLDAWSLQVDPLLEADPHRSIGWEEHQQAIPRMKTWVHARHAYLDSYVACGRGETTDADADGHPVCVDADDADPTIYPGAPETCNGRDDDVDGEIDELPSCDDCARHDVEDHHFLFCSNLRTWEEAEANCQARGGTLAPYTSTADFYMFYFYTWPRREHWWMAGEPDGGDCPTWNEAITNLDETDCDEPHRSICRLP